MTVRENAPLTGLMPIIPTSTSYLTVSFISSPAALFIIFDWLPENVASTLTFKAVNSKKLSQTWFILQWHISR